MRGLIGTREKDEWVWVWEEGGTGKARWEGGEGFFSARESHRQSKTV